MTLVLAVVVVRTYVWIVKSRGEDAPWMLWVFLTAVAGYGTATLVFALSRSFVLSFVALFLVGLSDMISTVVRQVLRHQLTLRRRLHQNAHPRSTPEHVTN